MKDKLIVVTQWNMIDDKWCWIEISSDTNQLITHCPFDSKQEAIARAKEVMQVMKYSYEVMGGVNEYES